MIQNYSKLYVYAIDNTLKTNIANQIGNADISQDGLLSCGFV
jgi:hypothetical protein